MRREPEGFLRADGVAEREGVGAEHDALRIKRNPLFQDIFLARNSALAAARNSGLESRRRRTELSSGGAACASMSESSGKSGVGIVVVDGDAADLGGEMVVDFFDLGPGCQAFPLSLQPHQPPAVF